MFALRNIFAAILLLSMASNIDCQLGAIREFLHSNLLGYPVIHAEAAWPFDPDISLKRRKLWEETNGKKGEKLIERLGLGIDGEADERLEKQHARDLGHLGGLNYFRP